MKKEIILIIILSLFVFVVGIAGEIPKHSKTRTIMLSGKMTDINNQEYLAGVKIKCSENSKAVYSDLDGNFLIYLEISSDENLTVEFSQIGYSSKVLNLQELQSSSSNLSVTLKAD